MFDVRQLTEPRPGLLYEPRVLWGMGLVTRLDDGDGVVNVRMPGRDSYLNGSKWPIVLTGMITLAQAPSGYGSVGASLMSQLPIELGALGGSRYSFGRVSGLASPVASRESQESVYTLSPDVPPLNQLASGVVPEAQLRSVQNLARWDFDHTLKLPPAAFLEMELSGRAPTIIDTSAVPVTADINFYAGGQGGRANWPGNTLTRTNFAIAQATIAAAQTYYATPGATIQTDGGPVLFNALPFQGFTGGAERALYPARQKFTSRDAVQQKGNYDMPTDLSGFSVGFDQSALDEALGITQMAGPLSATTYVRARSRNGGTQDYWWRDGAPVAICTPTMTPGVVSKLDRPLALQPGEGFKLTLPSDFDPSTLKLPFGGTTADDFQLNQCVFYISFTGYAVVEA